MAAAAVVVAEAGALAVAGFVAAAAAVAPALGAGVPIERQTVHCVVAAAAAAPVVVAAAVVAVAAEGKAGIAHDAVAAALAPDRHSVGCCLVVPTSLLQYCLNAASAVAAAGAEVGPVCWSGVSRHTSVSEEAAAAERP